MNNNNSSGDVPNTKRNQQENLDVSANPPQKKMKPNPSSPATDGDNSSSTSSIENTDYRNKRGGRRGKHKKRRDKRSAEGTGRRQGGNSDVWDSRWVDRDEQQNVLFEKFYRANLFDGEHVKDSEQRSILSEDEWTTFIKTLRTKLPITFRISDTHPEFAAAIRRKIEEEFVPRIADAKVSLATLEAGREAIPDESLAIHLPKEDNVKMNENDEQQQQQQQQQDEKERIVYPVQAPQPIEWYPNRLGWHVSTSKVCCNFLYYYLYIIIIIS